MFAFCQKFLHLFFDAFSVYPYILDQFPWKELMN